MEHIVHSWLILVYLICINAASLAAGIWDPISIVDERIKNDVGLDNENSTTNHATSKPREWLEKVKAEALQRSDTDMKEDGPSVLSTRDIISDIKVRSNSSSSSSEEKHYLKKLYKRGKKYRRYGYGRYSSYPQFGGGYPLDRYGSYGNYGLGGVGAYGRYGLGRYQNYGLGGGLLSGVPVY